MGDGRTAGDETEQIVARAGGKAGVEIIGHAGDGGDGDGMRAQVGVDGTGQTMRIPITVKIAVGDLTRSMHAGISAASALDNMIAGLQAGQCGLDGGLHGGLATGLALPAVKRPAVIVDFQGIARHMQGLADGCRPCNAKALALARSTRHVWDK